MNAKTIATGQVALEPTLEMSPTKYILRCVEQRKRKAAETQLIIIRLRSQAGVTTPR